MLAFYERGLRWVARATARRCSSSRSGRSALTVVLFIIVPKGLFPQQDTGLLMGFDRGAAGRLVRRDERSARARSTRSSATIPTSPLRLVHRRGGPATGQHRAPSFIDAQAAPAAKRDAPTRSSRGCAAEAREGRGDQPLSCSRRRTCASAGAWRGRSTSTRCRTRTSTSSAPGRRACSTRCASCPSSRTSTPISRTRGSQLDVDIDRDTASRLGITPQAIDDALYDAFGQRQVATTFTQLNQYRVVLEVKPSVPEHAGRRSTAST